MTEPASDVKPSPAPVAPDKAVQEQEQESTEDVYSLRPMQPILRLSQYGFSRGGMALSGRRQHNQHSYGQSTVSIDVIHSHTGQRNCYGLCIDSWCAVYLWYDSHVKTAMAYPLWLGV